MKHGKKLKTLQNEARSKGYQAHIMPQQIAINPKTGNMVRLRNRNTLYVYDLFGNEIIKHISGLPRTDNTRIEEKIQNLETRDVLHEN